MERVEVSVNRSIISDSVTNPLFFMIVSRIAAPGGGGGGIDSTVAADVVLVTVIAELTEAVSSSINGKCGGIFNSAPMAAIDDSVDTTHTSD